jgi:hypothetical protein
MKYNQSLCPEARYQVLYCRLRSVFLILTYSLLYSSTATSQEQPNSRPKIRASRVNAPPVLDGLVNEPFWQE